ncbi:hypothetical protein FQN54_002023 [Arachnomyces sp. PD_36]|nr:hypothetical protein FQN54_002023 [Arachnomyces sp. PD_36]
MNPYMSWAILLVVVGGLGWYYTGGCIPKAKPAVVKPVAEKTEAILNTKKPKKKAKKNPEANGRATPAAKPEAEPRETPTPTAVTESKAADDEVNNKDFAMQLSKVKNGTPIVPSAKKGPSKKERRTQKLNAKQQGSGNSDQSAHMSTRSSSTTGADADDDMSPVTSPVIAPASTSRDVSDMLEAPADGPSVLRLTGELKENKKQKPQSFKPVETKKQRQQKAKNEAKRLQVEEAEKQRRVLLEKQLHTSREFERREAAKNKPAIPLTNAWTTNNTSEKTNGAAPAPAPANNDTELLDTFTPVTSGKKKPNGKAAKDPRPPIPNVPQQRPAAQASEASTPKPKSGNWTDELPSEEEQMRILGAMSSENEWTTVPTRKKDKKAKVNGNEVEASTS